jgi:hypothetical protein
VSRSAAIAWIRLVALAVVGAGIAPRAAVAGCHVEAERPALGLSRPGEVLPVTDPAPAATEGVSAGQVVPEPCSGDMPGGLERANPAGAVALAEDSVSEVRPGSWRLRPESSRVRPILRPSSTDRPPRIG